MNTHRIFSSAIVVVFAFLLFGTPAPVSAAAIGVINNTDAVALWGWNTGTELTLTIDNPANGTGVDYTSSLIWNPGSVFYLGQAFDIQPGDIVKVTDGVSTRQVTVTNVRIMGVNLDTNTVYGGADPGDTIYVSPSPRPCFPGQQRQAVTADQNGNWVADFTGTCGLIGSTNISAWEVDAIMGDSGQTLFIFSVPTFTVYPQQNRVDTTWPVSNQVTLTIDNPSNGTGVDYTATKTAVQNSIIFDLGTFVTYPGDLVTITDGITTKKTVIANLAINGGDLDNDIVRGTADPGAVVQVLSRDDPNIFRNVTADTQGNWTADFSVPGGQPGEEKILDIQPDMFMMVNQKDEDGDQTHFESYVSNPHVNVRVTDDMIDGSNWPLGDTLTLKIDDPTTAAENPDYITTQTVGVASWDPSQTYMQFMLSGIYNIKPGDAISVSNGLIIKRTIVITNLAMTNFDVVADIVSGNAEAGSQVDVSACGNFCANRHVHANGSGIWVADFAHPGVEEDEQDIFDVVGGTWIEISQNDKDGDSTAYGESVPNRPQLTSLSPAKIWVGLQNSQDKGIKFDLKAEAYKDGVLITSGELDSVDSGGAGFNKAKLDAIPFNSFSPVDFPKGSQLSIKLYVRNSCSGSKNNGKTARLWYNDSQANSGFSSTIGSYYLVSSSSLSTSLGTGPQLTADVDTKTKCAPFSSFGTWTTTP